MKKLVVAAMLLVLASPVFAGEATLNAMVELLRQDIRTGSVAMIEEVMEFTEEEAEAFWPVYKEYEKEVRKLEDRRWELIKEYAKIYGTTTDAQAGKLVREALDLNLKKASLLKDYFRRFDRVLSTKRAAQYVQLQRQLDLLVDLQIASELPLIE